MAVSEVISVDEGKFVAVPVVQEELAEVVMDEGGGGAPVVVVVVTTGTVQFNVTKPETQVGNSVGEQSDKEEAA